MKINEISNRSEKLIETGNQLEKRLTLSKGRLSSAKSELVRAQMMYQTELSNRDEEDSGREGRLEMSRVMLEQARVKVALAQNEINKVAYEIEETNSEKRRVVKEFENHNLVKKGNLDKLNQLSGKRFGNNVSGMLMDVVEKMNLAERERVKLLNSMGLNSIAKTYTATVNGNAGHPMRSSSFSYYSDILTYNLSDYSDRLRNILEGRQKGMIKTRFGSSSSISYSDEEKLVALMKLREDFAKENVHLIEQVDLDDDLSRGEKAELLNLGKDSIESFNNQILKQMEILEGKNESDHSLTHLGIGYADFSTLDPRLANDIVTAFTDAKNDFPNLQVNYCGTIQNQITLMKATVSNEYAKKLKAENGNAYTDEDYKQVADEYAEQFFSNDSFKDIDRTFAWSLKIPDQVQYHDVLTPFSGIAINEVYGNDYEFFSGKKRVEVQTCHKPIGCNTPKATIDHELGHEIDNLLNANEDPMLNQMYKDMIYRGRGRDELSEYSKTNINEFIAEGYSEYKNNPNPRKQSVDIYERLIQLRDMR